MRLRSLLCSLLLLPLAAITDAKDRHMIHYFHGSTSALASDLGNVCKVSVTKYASDNAEPETAIRKISTDTFTALRKGIDSIPAFAASLVRDSATKLNYKDYHIVGLAFIEGGKKETRVFAIPAKAPSPEIQKWLRTLLGAEPAKVPANSKQMEPFLGPEDTTARELHEWLDSMLVEVIE